MNLNRLKVNRLTNPLGFEMNSLSFSWTVEETDAKKQQWARVEVAADESFQRLLWDSGEDAGLSSVDCPVTLDLQPRTRYWWRVTVQGDNGEQATSAAAWFETSKMGEEWAGKWIAPSLESSVHPLLRRSFFLEGGACPRPGLRRGPGALRAVRQRGKGRGRVPGPWLHRL